MNNDDCTYIVYKHVTPNGKIYIGQTCKRFKERCGKNGHGYWNCTYFYHAINKYGWDNIEHVVLVTGLTKKEADWTENYFIRYYDSNNAEHGYNLTLGGEGNRRKLSEEEKKAISIRNTGKHHSEETKRKIGLGNKGKKRSPEQCERIGNMRRGIKWDDEHKKRLSETNKEACKCHRKRVLRLEDGVIFESAVAASEALGTYKLAVVYAIYRHGKTHGYTFKYID